jgi:tryptophan-rich sensory protein
VKKGFTIVVFLIVVFCLHLISNLAKKHGIEWYQSLPLPFWAPTSSGIDRIWAGKFIFKAVAGALLWIAPKTAQRRLAIELWVAMVAADLVWPYLFFFAQAPLLTAIALLVEMAICGYLLAVSRRVDKAAFFFLIPYEAWLLFALALSVSIARNFL